MHCLDCPANWSNSVVRLRGDEIDEPQPLSTLLARDRSADRGGGYVVWQAPPGCPLRKTPATRQHAPPAAERRFAADQFRPKHAIFSDGISIFTGKGAGPIDGVGATAAASGATVDADTLPSTALSRNAPCQVNYYGRYGARTPYRKRNGDHAD